MFEHTLCKLLLQVHLAACRMGHSQWHKRKHAEYKISCRRTLQRLCYPDLASSGLILSCIGDA